MCIKLSNVKQPTTTDREGGKMAMRRAAPFSMISSPRDVSDSCHYLRDELKTHESSMRAFLISGADGCISGDLAITPHAGDRGRYDNLRYALLRQISLQ